MSKNSSDAAVSVSMRGWSCLCCASRAGSEEWGLVSPFLAARALHQPPFKTRVFRCSACSFAWSELGLTPEQAQRLYTDYRGEEYLRQRHHFEPWYSREKNDSIGSESTMQERRLAMNQTLERAGIKLGARPQGVVVDFGGDKGQMLKDLPDAEKWVYEMSGVEVSSWAKPITRLSDLVGQCNLALSCQVLEHVESPLKTAIEVVALVKKGGWVYLEVPDERWRQLAAGNSWRGRWLDMVARYAWLHKGLDFLSTASRIKLGWIAPFGFWSMREHLNFFTPDSLRSIGERAGLEVALVEKNASGLALVGVKK